MRPMIAVMLTTGLALGALGQGTVLSVAPRNKEVRLGDLVYVNVDQEALKRVSTAKEVTLVINGQNSFLEPVSDATAEFQFRLARNEKNSGLWARILEAPFRDKQAKIHLSVAFDGAPISAPDNVGQLAFLKSDFDWRAWIWIGLLIVVLVFFFHLAGTTDILRNGPSTGGVKQAYSLGRSQMAWWLFIVIVGYVVIWMISGNRDTVSNSTLVLVGISGATALGAVAIDSTASGRIKKAIERLNAELSTLTVLRATTTSPNLQAAIDQRIAAIQEEEANIVKSPQSVNWLMDVLTDDSGAVAVHRLQNLLWTFVLGVVFMVSVLHALSMPEFSNNLLALMGISAGTYLGFKWPTSG